MSLLDSADVERAAFREMKQNDNIKRKKVLLFIVNND